MAIELSKKNQITKIKENLSQTVKKCLKINANKVLTKKILYFLLLDVSAIERSDFSKWIFLALILKNSYFFLSFSYISGNENLYFSVQARKYEKKSALRKFLIL